MVSTNNSEFLFTSDSIGTIKKWNINKKKLSHEFIKAHRDVIYSMCVSKDSKFLFSSDSKGRVLQWDVNRMSLLNDFGTITDGVIFSISLYENLGEYNMSLIISDSKGSLNELKINRDNYKVYNIGKIHNAPILSSSISS